MRALVALTILTVCALTIGSTAATADDPVLSPPIPSTIESAPTPSFDMTAPMQPEYVPPSPADAMPAYESYPSTQYAAPPITSAYESMPRPSYQDVASGYPALSHSLVPSALSTGPMFVGSGSYGGASLSGTHLRYPYYSYRSPWTYGGPASVNHTIVW